MIFYQLLSYFVFRHSSFELCSDKHVLCKVTLSFIESVSSNTSSVVYSSLYSWTDGPPWPLIVLKIIIVYDSACAQGVIIMMLFQHCDYGVALDGTIFL